MHHLTDQAPLEIDDHGEVTVGQSAAALSNTPTNFTSGIQLINTDPSAIVYLGTSEVTGTGGAKPGWPLLPGIPLTWPTADISKVFAVAASGAPKVSWIGWRRA